LELLTAVNDVKTGPLTIDPLPMSLRGSVHEDTRNYCHFSFSKSLRFHQKSGNPEKRGNQQHRASQIDLIMKIDRAGQYTQHFANLLTRTPLV